MALKSVQFREPNPIPLEVVYEKKARNLEKQLFKLLPRKNEDIHSKIRRRALTELQKFYASIADEISWAKNRDLRTKCIKKIQILKQHTPEGKHLKKINQTIRANAKLKK